MTISMIDSAPAMTKILNADPGLRAEQVREMWAPMAGMYDFIPGGVDMADVHRQNFGFPWEDSSDRLRDGLDALVAADSWNRIAGALDVGVEALKSADPKIRVPDLNVLLVLGDPNNKHFLGEVQGLSGFGGISGYIALTVWPTPQVLNRLEAIAVHELHHNLRYSPGGIAWDPASVTVGEHVISEGLADVFAAELFGAAGYTHFVAEATRSDDDVLAKVITGLNVTGMQNFGAWVLGDATARMFGGEPVGLPTGSGYAAGARLVRAYLEATGGTAAQNLHTPATKILDIALRYLDIPPTTTS